MLTFPELRPDASYHCGEQCSETINLELDAVSSVCVPIVHGISESSGACFLRLDCFTHHSTDVVRTLHLIRIMNLEAIRQTDLSAL